MENIPSTDSLYLELKEIEDLNRLKDKVIKLPPSERKEKLLVHVQDRMSGVPLLGTTIHEIRDMRRTIKSLNATKVSFADENRQLLARCIDSENKLQHALHIVELAHQELLRLKRKYKSIAFQLDLDLVDPDVVAVHPIKEHSHDGEIHNKSVFYKLCRLIGNPTRNRRANPPSV